MTEWWSGILSNILLSMNIEANIKALINSNKKKGWMVFPNLKISNYYFFNFK